MIKKTAAIALALGMMSSANAALYSRAGGTMVYDDVLNITWLADWGQFSGTWTVVQSWASSLVVDGYSGWRLPTALNQDQSGPYFGYNQNSSEIGFMFYQNWGATAGSPPLTLTNTANLAMFKRVQLTRFLYWFDTEYEGDYAWVFQPEIGFQGITDKRTLAIAVAVRDGDVANVPVPATLALLGLGLIGIARQRSGRSTGKGVAQ